MAYMNMQVVVVQKGDGMVWPFLACICRHVGDVRLRLPDRLVTEVVVERIWRAKYPRFGERGKKFRA
jgi:hypothetical protein